VDFDHFAVGLCGAQWGSGLLLYNILGCRPGLFRLQERRRNCHSVYVRRSR